MAYGPKVFLLSLSHEGLQLLKPGRGVPNKSHLQLYPKIKYLGKNIAKDIKDLYLENYKTLKKESEENTNKSKLMLCSWIGKINIIKMLILLKVIYGFNKSPIKIPMEYFTEIKQPFQIFIWNHKRP